MWKKEAKNNLIIFLKAGLPFTILGMIVIFAGIYLIKHLFAQSEHLTLILFGWLAVFWIIYQPLFKNKIAKIKANMNQN